MALMGEKQVILRRQQEEVSKLMQMQVGSRWREAGPWAEGPCGLCRRRVVSAISGLREGRFSWPVFSTVGLYSLYFCISLDL